jgi:hypothetical protein
MLQNTSKANLVTAETTLVSQLGNVLPKGTMPISGKMMTSAQVTTLVRGHLDAIGEIDDLKARLRAAIQAERSQRAVVKAAVICVRNYAAGAFGEASAQYAALGFAPRKPAQKTAEAKALAVDKLRATRAARHTMGKRQRELIRGTLLAPASAVPAPVIAAGSGPVVTGANAVKTASTGSSTPAAGADGSTGASSGGSSGGDSASAANGATTNASANGASTNGVATNGVATNGAALH